MKKLSSEFKNEHEFKSEAGFKPKIPIYQLLAIHQRTEQWELNRTLAFFQSWTIKFNAEFKLGLQDLAIRVDKLPKRVLGMFRQGHNGFGLLNEVALSIEHVSKDELWDVLGTLLHELLQVWQFEHGEPPSRKNEHSAEFRAKAKECGLIVTEKGEQSYLPDSPFVAVLKAHEVPVPEFDGSPLKPNRSERPGKSKLALWVCQCSPPQKARVGRKEFFARCTVCKCLFQPDQGKKSRETGLAVQPHAKD